MPIYICLLLSRLLARSARDEEMGMTQEMPGISLVKKEDNMAGILSINDSGKQ